MMKVSKLNLALMIIALIMLLNLVVPIINLAGDITYSLDFSQPECYFKNDGVLNKVPLDRCCVEVQKQIECEPTQGMEYFKCFISESSPRHYLINTKTYHFCKKEGYDVKISE